MLEAISALREKQQFRAALAVAKTRFPEDVPLIKELYTAWAHQAQNDGQYGKCAISMISIPNFYLSDRFQYSKGMKIRGPYLSFQGRD